MSSKIDTIDGNNQNTEEIQVSDSVTGQIGFQVEGTFTGTLEIQGSLHDDMSTVVAIQGVNRNDGSAVTTITAPGIYVVDAAGLTKVRLRSTSWTSGSATVRKKPHIG